MEVFVGHDWAEAHHDVCIQDGQGTMLARRRLPDGIAGMAALHELIGAHTDDPGRVVVGTETDRGLFVAGMVATGYQVYAVNPLSTSRYRDRHGTSGAKSDPGDAKVLADMVRTDRHNLRAIAGDTVAADAVRTLARAHQSMIWTRQRQTNQLRSVLREFYPAAQAAFPDLKSGDALAVLAIAPTPTQGRALSRSRIASALRRGGRQRRIDDRAIQIQQALRGQHLTANDTVADAMGTVVAGLVPVIVELNRQIGLLETQLAHRFEVHPDAKIILSLPGLGTILGARVLAEFGDDPNRYADAKARRNYAGTSPITRASGKHRVVLARYARNKRLADACYQWAFAAITASPGARTYYDHRRSKGDTHHRALRALANRLVGILHGCLRHNTPYNEHTAWHHRTQLAA